MLTFYYAVPPVWDFLCFKSSFSRCSALQSTLAALRISILRQRSSSNIHAGSSNGLALTLFSLRHRRIPSPCFSRSSWIQTARPYQGCHRYRTSWDSILWVFDCELVLYGSGLRLMEALTLWLKDIDFS